MKTKLGKIYDRTTYLNTFELPHGKNLMPYSLKKVPLWFLDHVLHEIRVRVLDILRTKKSALLMQIWFLQLRRLKKLELENRKGETKYFAANPNPRAGIGHQMSSVLAALELAHQKGIEFAISGLSADWASEFGFTSGVEFADVQIAKQVNLGAWNEIQDDKYAKAVKKALSMNYSKPILFRAPFNDSKIDLTVGGKLLQEQYIRTNSKEKPGEKKLVVHIRRPRIGDSSAKGPMRNLPNEAYFEKILEVRMTEHFQKMVTEIVLLGVDLQELRGLKREIESETGKRVVPTMGCCDVGAFRLLATSEIMIGSRSGFSYTAGLVNPGKIYFPVGFWHKVPDHWELF